MEHKRRTIRLKAYDYTQAGAYFVTICVNDRKYLFGDVKDGKTILNDTGKIIDSEWNKLPQRFPNIELNEHIIMPNHMQGIINVVVVAGSPRMNNGILSPRKSDKNLSSNINNQTPGTRIWQRNYYEHINRDEYDLNRICDYITNNPAQWNKDEYYLE